MTTAELAADFAAMCAAGHFDQAGEKYWSSDIVSVEAMGPETHATGIDAVRAKGEWWYANHEIHNIEAHGPFVNGDQFIVRFKMDVTNKQSNDRMQMDEEALYTVKNGKIVEERFFYGS